LKTTSVSDTSTKAGQLSEERDWALSWFLMHIYSLHQSRREGIIKSVVAID